MKVGKHCYRDSNRVYEGFSLNMGKSKMNIFWSLLTTFNVRNIARVIASNQVVQISDTPCMLFRDSIIFLCVLGKSTQKFISAIK